MKRVHGRFAWMTSVFCAAALILGCTCGSAYAQVPTKEIPKHCHADSESNAANSDGLACCGRCVAEPTAILKAGSLTSEDLSLNQKVFNPDIPTTENPLNLHLGLLTLGDIYTHPIYGKLFTSSITARGPPAL